MDNPQEGSTPLPPQVVEVQLVQEGRVGGDQLFALEAIDGESCCSVPVQRRKLAAQGVQALDGTRVVVFVVTGDEAARQTRELIGVQSQGRIW